MALRRRRGSAPPALRAIAIAPGFAILIVALPIIIALSPFILLNGAISHFRYLRRHRGRTYLVASRCRGWFDFIDNNVLPALPAAVVLVWCEEARRHSFFPPPLGHLPRKHPHARPFLVHVTRFKMVPIPLHDALRPMKAASRKRDPAVQAQVRRILDEALAGRG